MNATKFIAFEGEAFGLFLPLIHLHQFQKYKKPAFSLVNTVSKTYSKPGFKPNQWVTLRFKKPIKNTLPMIDPLYSQALSTLNKPDDFKFCHTSRPIEMAGASDKQSKESEATVVEVEP